MSRVRGANYQAMFAFESTYKVIPTTGFYKIPFISSDLGSEQPLIENDVLGYGRDSQAPMQDVISAGGNITLPLCARNAGLFLQLIFGEDKTETNNASGYIHFGDNPSDTETVVINGVTWTFKSSPSGGTDVQIGVDLNTTLQTFYAQLNASENSSINVATYAHAIGSPFLTITHDTAGLTGEAFTLALGTIADAEVSATTLITNPCNAWGYIRFKRNPTDGETMAMNGTTYTFKDSPTGDYQIQIGADLDTTLESTETKLNAATAAAVVLATYSHSANSNDLEIQHDIAGAKGNDFTLAVGSAFATVSAATLVGGDLYKHTYVSAEDTLSSAVIEFGNAKVPSYAMNYGIVGNSIGFTWERSGGAKISVDCVAAGEDIESSSQVASSTTLVLQRFMQFKGSAKYLGTHLANLSNISLNYQNNLDTVDSIRDDGEIEGADPAEATANGQITMRFADTTLLDKAAAFESIALQLGWLILSGEKLTIDLYEVYLPKPKISIPGPGGIEVTYDYRAAYNADAGKMLQIQLCNNVAHY